MPPRQEPAHSTSMATATQTVGAVPFRRQIVVVVAAPARPVRPSPSDRESMCPYTLFQPLFGFLPRTRAGPRNSTAHAFNVRGPGFDVLLAPAPADLRPHFFNLIFGPGTPLQLCRALRQVFRRILKSAFRLSPSGFRQS